MSYYANLDSDNATVLGLIAWDQSNPVPSDVNWVLITDEQKGIIQLGSTLVNGILTLPAKYEN